MTKTTLGELLTREQLDAVYAIIERNPDPIHRVWELKQYLNQFQIAADLEKKGVVADYLVYVIEYMIQPRPELN